MEIERKEPMRERIARLRQEKMKEAFVELQSMMVLWEEKPKEVLVNFGKRLKEMGVEEREFTGFLKREVRESYLALVRQGKREWFKALSTPRSEEETERAKSSIMWKFGLAEMVGEKGEKLLAFAKCVEGARRGAVEYFSNLSEEEVKRIAEVNGKAARLELERMTREEIGSVYKKIVFGVEEPL
ncbi:MAG: hypothetical protein QXF56_02665 [Candidatus Micrarchaeia archaeon]